MTAADPPSGLLDIASTLSQDEIPFKLRCAICNKLAVNAFRLPCCDQSICEICQTSLPDTCPVCAHYPVSADLCKPNKALRTTLKAFLRTEEKKREKERQSAAPVTPTTTSPVEDNATQTQPTVDQGKSENIVTAQSHNAQSQYPAPADGSADLAKASDPAAAESQTPDLEAAVNETGIEDLSTTTTQQGLDGSADHQDGGDEQTQVEDTGPPAERDGANEPSQEPNGIQPGVTPGNFPGMTGWNGNNNFTSMNAMMANPMFNFPNNMGMPMTMDPMTANQGMFGDYGMNMAGMGMNMGMNFNGQGMYGSLGWNGSQQNMWHGGQDNFNPNAFANGTGPPFGGAFGGSNMSYPSNSDFQSGYYGPGYGRGGGYRGRGRGHYAAGPGPGHRAYGAAGDDHQFPQTGNPGLANGQPGAGQDDIPVQPDAPTEKTEDASSHTDTDKMASTDLVSTAEVQATDDDAARGAAESKVDSADNNADQSPQLQGIPTIDSLDQPSDSMEVNGYPMFNVPGYGRGGYMRGGFHGPRGGGHWGGMPNMYQQGPVELRNPGVEGAPAAPRAMRQGLPNTSILRQRGFHMRGKGSMSSTTPASSQRANSEAPGELTRTRSPSRAPSQARQIGKVSRSPSHDRASRAGSHFEGDERRPRAQDGAQVRPEPVKEIERLGHRSRSPSRMSSRRSSRRRDRDEPRDRRNGHHSHRSRRHRSRSDSRARSVSPLVDGDRRHPDRLKPISEGVESKAHGKGTVESGVRGDLASRIGNGHRSSQDVPHRRDEGRERDRDRGRERERERDRDRDRNKDRDRKDRHREKNRDSDRRDRARDSDREPRQTRDRDRDRDRDRQREKDHDDRDRERDRVRDRGRGHDRGSDRDMTRKRRRDRSESAAINNGSSAQPPQARRVKTNGDARDREQTRPMTAKSESEKDPYTLEREARNRERLLREQQNRGNTKSSSSKPSHRRDSRQERLVGGRRINYKYEDEL
ncbi:hypothetical protein N7539_004642 [Penicillium diatomitis]|uniref:RING-type domain-containing protein n=1 Tax=Penicillium diatomitis TaxID=2819901 RepID=A0A9W9XEE1_9EURO|nr:uncharacterized protein N7539_004642 [Penicillium diatomitis]KAJ5489752.1 hypothetical protein N7539_004642 [Penicillium diatomitis]